MVVVGTRPSTSDGPDHKAGDTDIIDALTGNNDASVVIKELRVLPDPDALRAYAELRLSHARSTSKLTATDEDIKAAVRLICDDDREGRSGRQFLYARLAVHEIMARPELIQPTGREELAKLLSGGHGDLFGAAVDRLSRESPAFSPLLQALALARGRGVPRTEDIWRTMANAVANATIEEPDHIEEEDIDQLLVDAAPYIMLDAEHRQSVYRLAHRTFQEYFEEMWRRVR